MDPFRKIHFPILIAIAKDVPDLASLHSLRVASPICAALLTDQKLGAEIVEAVATASLSEDNQTIFGYIWEMLQRPESEWSTHPGVKKVRHETSCIRSRFISSPPTAESTLRMLALAKVVHCAAHRCLHTLLQRFVALKPRLGHIRRLYPVSKQPPGELVAVDLEAAAAPISWAEEQRAIWGAWQLALLSVARESPCASAWPPGQTRHWHLVALGMQRRFGMRDLPQTILDRNCSWDVRSAPQRLSEVFSSAPECDETCYLLKQPSPEPSRHETSLTALRFFNKARTSKEALIWLASMAPFRPLGFAIWEERRFIAMGLNWHGDDIRDQSGLITLDAQTVMYAWKSLLTPTEMKALEARQRTEWERLCPGMPWLIY